MNRQQSTTFFAHRRAWLAAALIAVATPSHALFGGFGRIVYDPTNHVQNTISAVKATAAEITRYRQLITDLRQNLNAFNIASSVIGDSPELRMLMEGYQAAQQLHGALTEGRRTIESIQNVFASSRSVSWQQFARDLVNRRNVGEASAVRLMDSVVAVDKQIQAAARAHQQIARQLSSVSGVTEATQATANAVGVLIQQNQAMLASLSAQANDQAIERQRETLEREAEERALVEYTEAERSAIQRDLNRFRGNAP